MPNISQIDVHRVNEMLIQESATIIDIRDPGSFAMGHIPTALSLTEQNVDQVIGQLDKEKTLVVCCYHGISSQGAAGYLMSRGFKEVHSMIGGYEAWQMNYPSE
ncbi:MAG: thiosulfate sulfurtransferase GlpE [Nitrospinota bacterium]|jgi:thiosulfate sulfurtransferase|nr:thiosulfate sulfurtransferase GlpE [Nitrospinota bacterium]